MSESDKEFNLEEGIHKLEQLNLVEFDDQHQKEVFSSLMSSFAKMMGNSSMDLTPNPENTDTKVPHLDVPVDGDFWNLITNNSESIKVIMDKFNSKMSQLNGFPMMDPTTPFNFSGVDMRGVDMSGVDMSGVDMSGVDMSGVNLDNLPESLSVPFLTGGLDLSNLDLSNLDLSKLNFGSLFGMGALAQSDVDSDEVDEEYESATSESTGSID